MEEHELMKKLGNNRGVVWGMSTQREINRRLKILDEVIEKDNIKYQDNCLFGLRVRDLLRKENLLKG
jgi:hypothetical protein